MWRQWVCRIASSLNEHVDMWHAQVKEVEAVAAAEEGAVKEEDVADAAAVKCDGPSAKAEPELAASSTPAAAPEKAAVKPDEASAKVFPGSSHPDVPRFLFFFQEPSCGAAYCGFVCAALLTSVREKSWHLALHKVQNYDQACVVLRGGSLNFCCLATSFHFYAG